MLKNKHFLQRQFKKIDNQKASIFMLAIFMILSFLCISPSAQKTKSTYHSSQLYKIYTKDEETEKTEYKDSRGILTIAADLGYAVMIVSRNESSRLERYYDEHGEPISRYDGYYAVLREYNERGNNIRNTYLDDEDNPMMTLSGYAIQERMFNEDNQVVSIKYLDTEGEPVRTASYGYEQIYEYDENGNNSKIIYCDDSGNPMITKQGYASILRNFYVTEGPENGKVESEFYFDEEGNPISLSLGQYGVHKEYDECGRESVLTYLNASGNPLVTNKGYTTVVRTFLPNNSVETERYFDIEGTPFSLSEGQYGVKNENGKTIYLDQKGEKTFNLRRFLYNQSWIVIPIALFFVILASRFSRKMNCCMLAIYILCIAYFTLFFRDNEGTKIILLFRNISKVFTDSEARADVIKNIWLFIPLGAILYKICPNVKIILVAVVLSIILEEIQLIFGIGFFEPDDIICNSFGGYTGFYTCKLTADIIERIKSRRHIHNI